MNWKKEYIHSGKNKKYMKYEIKIEYTKTKELKELIESSYILNSEIGNLSSNRPCLEISDIDPIYHFLKGLNNMTIRIFNEDIIDGTCRFVIDEQQNFINLHPCSIYCTVEDGRYSFY